MWLELVSIKYFIPIGALLIVSTLEILSANYSVKCFANNFSLKILYNIISDKETSYRQEQQ